MRKYTFDNEKNIISYFRDIKHKVLAYPQSDEISQIFQSISDEKLWQSWIDSSSKADLPPDFFNPELKFMMEVMMFDDRATIDGRKHATKKRESEMLRELKDSGLESDFFNLKDIFILADSKLSTDDDHNFTRFRGNFNRVIMKHANKVKRYRQNHPDYKLVFFIFDESSGIYFENPETGNVKFGNTTLSRPHFYWCDNVMVESIKKSGADYVIWFKPYNSFKTNSGIIDDFPKVIIYELNKMKFKTETYHENRMISSEM